MVSVVINTVAGSEHARSRVKLTPATWKEQKL